MARKNKRLIKSIKDGLPREEAQKVDKYQNLTRYIKLLIDMDHEVRLHKEHYEGERTQS